MMSPTNELSAAAMTALKKRRDEIATRISVLQRQVADLRSDLLHIDHTIYMMDPDYTPNQPRRVRVKFSSAGYFERGELTRRIYEGFRRSEVITAAELTDKAMIEKKITDHRVRAYFVSRFLSRLSGLANDGKLIKVREGFNVRWKLADSPAKAGDA